MPARSKRLAIGTTVVLVSGLGVTGLAGPASASIEDGSCPGMTAPQNNRTVNQAPVPANDKATVLAGQIVAIRPLSNDTDPDGDRLAVVNVSTPGRGETCLSRTGTIEYLAPPSTRNSTQKLTYGVTDGERYRTATVAVSVVGIKPVRVTVTQRLTFKKHTHKVKTRARVAFTNLNKVSIVVLAGSPKKPNPSFHADRRSRQDRRLRHQDPSPRSLRQLPPEQRLLRSGQRRPRQHPDGTPRPRDRRGRLRRGPPDDGGSEDHHQRRLVAALSPGARVPPADRSRNWMEILRRSGVNLRLPRRGTPPHHHVRHQGKPVRVRR